MDVSSGEVINRVAQSSLVTLDLEALLPTGPRVLLDIKDQLFQGLILREKDFRAWVKDHDWAQYTGAHVAITCSADAIVPVWAYMLLATVLEPVAETVVYGGLGDLETVLCTRALDAVDWAQYRDEKVVLKGCGHVPAAVYVAATARLMPHAQKLMYGEPCSMVPLYKRG
ncbi:MAG: DUF2480 family protein [Bacteroidia bacterium]|nr:DUF2480 family protein [Bacteroidia bacterium]